MMYKEFEEIAGYEVSFEDYSNIIEPMYIASGLDKREFVKCIDKKRFALKTESQLIRAMRKEAASLKETFRWHCDYETEEKLDDLIKEFEDRFHYSCWIQVEYEIPSLKRGCTYPASLNVYDKTSGAFIKNIKLA